jgi:modulator of FtsH protease
MTNYRPAETEPFGTITHELGGSLQAKVFGLLTFAFAFAAAGGYVAWQLELRTFWPVFIAQMALVFVVGAVREKDGLNLLALYATTFVNGLLLGQIIQSYANAGLGGLVLQAAGITGVMTVGLSAYALTTKRDLSGLQPMLFIAVLGLVAAAIANIWVGGTLLSAIIGWAGALIFSLYLVYDVNRTRYVEDTMGNAVLLTLGIYLNIINLFLSILRILQASRR